MKNKAFKIVLALLFMFGITALAVTFASPKVYAEEIVDSLGEDEETTTEEIKKEEIKEEKSVMLSQTQLQEINDRKEEKVDALKEKDPDFYTRSMDLSDKDFDLGDDFKEKSLPLGVKILIFLIIVIIILITAYIIYKKII